MLRLFKQLDQLLRGEKTRAVVLQEEGFHASAGGFAVVVVILCMIYGVCMGSFSLLKEVPDGVIMTGPAYMQMVATTIKVPLLFSLTLIITLPSLYVLNALVGSQLSAASLVRLLIASLAVNAAVLASMGPIVLFFSLSTKSYSFILLLNVAAYTIAGVLSLLFLLQTLHRLTVSQPSEHSSDDSSAAGAEKKPEEPASPRGKNHNAGSENEPHALEMPSGQVLAKHTRLVFRCWVMLFALVGAQTGWVLRPFIGSPGMPFTWFRERQSNFFSAVIDALINLLGGG
jgi:hypothetical protein